MKKNVYKKALTNLSTSLWIFATLYSFLFLILLKQHHRQILLKSKTALVPYPNPTRTQSVKLHVKSKAGWLFYAQKSVTKPPSHCNKNKEVKTKTMSEQIMVERKQKNQMKEYNKSIK